MYQQIQIVGHVGKDAEMRYTPDGQAVTNFNVAVNKSKKDANGQTVKETTWFRVTAWGKQAETCGLYVKKGMLVLVSGELQADKKTGGPRIYDGKNGPGASFEITAGVVRFLTFADDGG